MKYFLLIIFISLTFISCKKENHKKIYIVTEDAYNKDRKKRLDSTYLEIIADEQKRIYNYGYVINDSLISNYLYVEKMIDNNEFLRIYDFQSMLVDTVSFVINGKTIKIFKYLYDKENISDDRIDYYFNEELGLIFAKNLAWNINTYYNSKSLKPLHDSILKNQDKFKSSFNIKLKASN